MKKRDRCLENPGEVTYTNLNPTRYGAHMQLRNKGHHSSNASKSMSDEKHVKSLIREATKWPEGHNKKRERERNLRRRKDASNIN